MCVHCQWNVLIELAHGVPRVMASKYAQDAAASRLYAHMEREHGLVDVPELPVDNGDGSES